MQKDQAFNLSKSVQGIWHKMLHWLDSLILALPNFVLAVLVFIGFIIIGKYVYRLTIRLLHKRRLQDSIRITIVRFIKIVIIGIGLFIALGLLNLDMVLKTVLASAGLAGLAIGFALQGTLKNTVSGVILSFIPEVKIHDWIETKDYAGEVLEVNLRNILIKESDNHHVIIPNSIIVDGSFKNLTSTKRSRVTIESRVGFESDLDFVEKLTTETLDNLFAQESGEMVEFYFKEFGQNSIKFIVRFWTDVRKQRDIWIATHKAVAAIKKAFDANDINIPFPIRTLDFDKSKFRAEPMEIVSKKDEE